ncbi:MAG: tetratricopeptide repeat protein, partial [Deltaproteobacteria bacterium]|nr:tetratricopeptide repeat protein [Deltaproteobacteria bacterium]
MFLLVPVLLAAARPAAAAPPENRTLKAGVLPLVNLRQPKKPDWLGLYFQDVLSRTFLKSNRMFVLDQEAVRLWATKLSLPEDALPQAGQLKTMGLDVLIMGSTRSVLSLVEVSIRAAGPQGDLLPGGEFKTRISLLKDQPRDTLEKILQHLYSAFLPGLHPAVAAQPKNWDSVRQLYSLLAQPVDLSGEARREERLKKLADLARIRGLTARAQEEAALIRLEQAMVHSPPGKERLELLQQAMGHITASLEAEPLDSDRGVIKAELHYLLDEQYQAKTEASVARIKNPLNALAHLVLGLSAGLSTGEATERLRTALRINPFLKGINRPPQALPYQGGALEPFFARWETLRARMGKPEDGTRPEEYTRGVELFEKGEFDKADALFREALNRLPDDPQSRLYRCLIMVETGRIQEAVPLLQELSDQHPENAAYRFYLARAQ